VINQTTLAASVLALLQNDPRNYLNFGPYWPLIKALLKKHYTRDNLYLLGDHTCALAATHMPKAEGLADALQSAVEFYRNASAYGFFPHRFTDEATGEAWTLDDPDAGGI
jgi:hypothetical protein